MTEIKNNKARKTSLPRTGRELDAMGGGGFSYHGGASGSSGDGESIPTEIKSGDGIKVKRDSRYSYTISHEDTSAADSLETKAKKAVSSVMVDTFGHVTSLDTCDILDLEDLDLRYLRKDMDDTTPFSITVGKDIVLSGDESSLYSKAGANDFNHKEGLCLWADGTAWLRDLRVKGDSMFAGSLSSPTFVSGFPDGTGWMLAPYRRMNAAGVEETRYKLEIDDVDVRGRMRIHEFVVSQLLGENDNRIFAGMMEVDHYDPASGRIYLDTDGGRLYNPFRQGDICMVRQFQGKPTMENGYDVTKSYEFAVKAVGVGDLSDGEDRLDWLTFENLVGDISRIARRDTVVRVDSLTDPTRKGIIKITTIDEFGTPYLDVAYGMRTDPGNATKVRIGNLGGIVTPYFGRLDGYGGYMENLFARGKFILSDTGEDVSTNFKLLNGRLSSEMSSVRYELLEKDNYLTNSSFSADLSGWETDGGVSLFTVRQRFISLNGGLYANRDNTSGIEEVYSRYALRLIGAEARQLNGTLAGRPGSMIQMPDGTSRWPLFHVTMMARAKTAGTLSMGFEGGALYKVQELAAMERFERVEMSGEWDGTGDFKIAYTGEIHIYNLLLTNRPLDDFRLEIGTKLEQTDKRIGLYADKVDNLSGTVTAMGIELDNTTESLSLYVTKTDNIAKTVTDLGVKLDGMDESLTLFAKKKDVSGLREELGASIELNAESITQMVSKEDYTGEKIVGYINMQPETIKISAKNIELDGRTIADIIEATAITTGLLTVTEGAIIGPFVISPVALVGLSSQAAILMGHDKGSVQIGWSEAEVEVSCHGGRKGVIISADTGALGLRVEASGSGSEGIVVSSSSSATGMTIDSTGTNAVALLLAGGYISGLKVQARRIAADYQITNEDVFLSCSPIKDIALTLPPSPQLGEMKIIRRNNGYKVTVSRGEGPYIRKAELTNTVEVGEGLGDAGLFLFDGQYWNYNVMLR